MAQSVDGDVTTFAWDWATPAAGSGQAPVPELLRQGETRYLVGHDTLGWNDGAGWTYPLPDALGSVRQVLVLSEAEGTDAAGAVTSSREWTPFGVALALSGAEGAGESPAGLGYTGEWWDADVGLEYLRARWYQPGTGRFTSRDPSRLEQNLYTYAQANPLLRTDPTGYFSNETIASSLGVATFDEVIQMFYRSDFSYAPPTIGGDVATLEERVGNRWGFLKLLQEAKMGDTLSFLNIGFFGKASRVSKGQLTGAGCTLWVGNLPLKQWIMSNSQLNSELPDGFLWRKHLQAYYLNGRPFRDGGGPDGFYTDLPDMASIVINGDLPINLLGAGVSYSVDRYGQAYVSVIPSFGPGIGFGSFGYTESYVNSLTSSHILSEEELEQVITGASMSDSINLLMSSFSVEMNLGHNWDNYWTGVAGFVLGQLSISVDFSGTSNLPSNLSVNPQGWIGVEDLPRYYIQDTW